MSSVNLSQESQRIKDYVIKMIDYISQERIQTLKREDHRAYFEKMVTKFSQLKEKFPSLFNMIIELDDPRDFEMHKLDDLLMLRDRVRNNQISSERASLDVGQRYFNEYVEPKIDRSKEPGY